MSRPTSLIRLSRLVASVVLILPAIAGASTVAGRAPAPPVVHALDFDTQIDVNRIAMFVTNTGSFAWDKVTAGQPPGFEFPRGSGKHAIFAAGLWLAAQVDGEVRVAVSEYSDEYAPGPIVGSGAGAVPADPNDPIHRVYKLKKDYSQGGDAIADLAAYTAGAVPYGAPPVTFDQNGDLDFVGDQMLWSVFNDLDPTFHTGHPGGTAPLGVEVQQTTWAFDTNDPLADVVFIRYRLINKGSNVLDSMFVGIWSDPDVGSAFDDLVACDVPRGLGFAYNANNSDPVYGSEPPSVGIDFLEGPSVGGGRLSATSFSKYINGTDPSAASHVYGYLRGFYPTGDAILDPTTNQPTSFMVSGDPIAGTGWIDTSPADRRMLLGSGPFTMLPGDSQDVVVAVVAGQGSDRFASILHMKAADDAAQALFDTPVPVSFAWFHAGPAGGGIEIRWRLEDDRRFPYARLERADNPEGPWSEPGFTRWREDSWIVTLDRGVEPGRTYHYRLVTDGPEGPIVLARARAVAGAGVVVLAPPWPNPSKGPFMVEFALGRDTRIRLVLLDLHGREVALLRSGDVPAGRHQVAWDESREPLAPGVYHVRLETAEAVRMLRVAIVR